MAPTTKPTGVNQFPNTVHARAKPGLVHLAQFASFRAWSLRQYSAHFPRDVRHHHVAAAQRPDAGKKQMPKIVSVFFFFSSPSFARALVTQPHSTVAPWPHGQSLPSNVNWP